MASTLHRRGFSNAPPYSERSAEQRAADSKTFAPKYARERRVNSMLTAKYLKAKTIFDKYYDYDIDEAFDAKTGAWDEAKDPWLRIKDTLPEFLEAYTEIMVENEGGHVTKEGLQNLAVALVRVARADWEGAGRDKAELGEGFEKEVMETVERLKTEHGLPDHVEEESEEEEEEANGEKA